MTISLLRQSFRHALLCGGLAGSLLLSSTSLAGPAEADAKFKNGVPFAQLAAEIEANSTDIEALQATTGALQVGLDGVETRLDGLEFRVAESEGEVAVLRSAVVELGAAIADGLAGMAELGAVIAQLRADSGANGAAIAELEDQIGALAKQVKADLSSMAKTIAGLQKVVDGNQGEIKALHALVKDQYVETQNQIEKLRFEIARVESDLTTLLDLTMVEQVLMNGKITSLQTQLVNLQDSFSSMTYRLYSLESTQGQLRSDLGRLQYEYFSHQHLYTDYFNPNSYRTYLTTTPL